SLLDKSLLLQSVQKGQEPNLLMLLTVREYGLKLLRERGEIEQCQRAHALYYLAFVEEAELHLKGIQQIPWMARLEGEQENLRLALAWLIEHGEAEYALCFCAALWRFWHLRGYWSEGRRWLEASLALPQAEGSMLARTKALCAAGELAYYQDDYGVARTRLEESVALCRALAVDRELANALGALGVIMHIQGEHAIARSLHEESEAIYRRLDSKWELSYFLRKLAFLSLQEGSLKRAMVLAQEALTLAQVLGDKSLMANTFATLGQIAARENDLTHSMAHIKESLTLARELGNKYLIAIALQNLGYLAALQGNLIQAAASAREGFKFVRELGDKLLITTTLHTLGYLTMLRGDISEAAAYFQEGLSVAQEIGAERHISLHLMGLAEVAIAEGHLKRAARLFGVAETILNPNVDLMTAERADYERVVESMRSKLGDKAFKTALAEGRILTPEQALTLPEEDLVPRSPASVISQPAPTYPDGLTPRQVEVLRLLAEGQTVDQIAEQLVVSSRTVSTHITAIYRKIQVNSRSAATRYAIEHGLI
ncbi:MAG TPA: LuxR C-terminal-related transcriptional regulator, partial [Ktedonobacteraceae bacterium]|nr:LuxR C-terminal-related transcriptional regulator [Ktedonobacteraceae bacterium]